MIKINNNSGLEKKTKMFTEEVVETSLEQKDKESSFNPFKIR